MEDGIEQVGGTREKKKTQKKGGEIYPEHQHQQEHDKVVQAEERGEASHHRETEGQADLAGRGLGIENLEQIGDGF